MKGRTEGRVRSGDCIAANAAELDAELRSEDNNVQAECSMFNEWGWSASYTCAAQPQDVWVGFRFHPVALAGSVTGT